MSARVEFGTKAETLERLAPQLRAARVLPQARFTVGEWIADADGCLARVPAAWLGAPAIVRSSALAEDAAGASLAGRYPSVGGCVGAAAVRAGAEAVAAALGPDDQVFVQPELVAVRASGVVVTRDPSSGARTTIVSWDETTGRTDAITSGRAEDRRTYLRHAASPEPPDPALAPVLALADELRALLGADALDLEYAVDAGGALHLLQVRPLAVPEDGPSADEEAAAVRRVRARLEELARPHPYLHGARGLFGSMPDWNPAEVIGARPRPLAFSLYRELITDGIWAYQRSNYGYRNLRSFPLVVSFGGLPYVDVRVSFNSFVPADLDDDLGRRLVDEYTRRLLAAPHHHDKVEFAVVHSCDALDLPERLDALAERGFAAADRERLAASLRALTNGIVADDGPFRRDLARIAELERRQAAFAAAAGGLDPVSRVYWLLEDCKRWGTLPFAGIARAAFVAVQLLDSFVAVGALDDAERERFRRSLSTVPGRMQRDLAALPRAAFLERYGHLRPGTYEVTSPRYDAAPDAYFERAGAAPPPDPPPFALPAARRRDLDARLADHGLALDADGAFAFLRDAIEGREAAKFTFTRSLSDALEALAELAAEHGLDRESLAHADIEVVRRLHAGTDDPGAVLRDSVAAGRARFAVTRRLTLPPLLTAPADADAFHLPPCEPSFVTLGCAEGPVVAGDADGADLRGGVVLVPSADPGYDWIFSRSIAGFVTQYGGYNSHMAIRASELGVPAVIGAGEALFRAWSIAARLRVDCLNRRVEALP